MCRTSQQTMNNVGGPLFPSASRRCAKVCIVLLTKKKKKQQMLQCRFKIINMVGLYLTGHFAVAFLPINAVKRAREVKGNSSLQGEKLALVDPNACERHSTPPRICLCIHVCEHVREVVCVCVQDVFLWGVEMVRCQRSRL